MHRFFTLEQKKGLERTVHAIKNNRKYAKHKSVMQKRKKGVFDTTNKFFKKINLPIDMVGKWCYDEPAHQNRG